MKKEPLPKTIHSSWKPYLEPLFQDERMKYIKYQVLSNIEFLPLPEQIFKVFSMPIDDVKLVILGQDPYPNKGVPNGYAFAVNEDCDVPVSLSNIARELEIEGFEIDYFSSNWKTLQHWVDQGVFLLNTSLTVKVNKPGSHVNHWSWFTERVIEILQYKVNPVWMLWGNHAKSYKRLILKVNKDARIVSTAHPAAEAYKENAGFYNTNCFTKATDYINLKTIKF